MNPNMKAEQRRRQAMRDVMTALSRLEERVFALIWQSPSGEPSGDVWSWGRLRTERERLLEWRRRLREGAPDGAIEDVEDEIPFRVRDVVG